MVEVRIQGKVDNEWEEMENFSRNMEIIKKNKMEMFEMKNRILYMNIIQMVLIVYQIVEEQIRGFGEWSIEYIYIEQRESQGDRIEYVLICRLAADGVFCV